MQLLDSNIIKNEVMPYLSPRVKSLLQNIPDLSMEYLEEIRLRLCKPLMVKLRDVDCTINSHGRVLKSIEDGYIISEEDIFRTIAAISDNSLYAFEEEIRRGFITIPGGHRVGLAGQVIVQDDEVRGIKDFSGICIRVAREIKGCARPLLSTVCSDKGQVNSTLIVSPPRCGKTTILRDLARLLSGGGDKFPAHNVVIVDERSELAGSYRGIPQLDVGVRTDVLDACPKALGMIMAIRSLSPQIIITDEIGRIEDLEAINECVNAGVKVISTIHALDIKELKARPLINKLLQNDTFQKIIFLSRRQGPGTIEDVVRWDNDVV